MWGSMGSRGAALAILALAREDADIPCPQPGRIRARIF